MNTAELTAACAALVPAISEGRRRAGRVVTGPSAMFATDLDTVFVPSPAPSHDPRRPLATVVAGIALQASPTKHAIIEIDLAALNGRQRRALQLVEGAASLGWVRARWPGFAADIHALAPELEPGSPEVDAELLLDAALRLARTSAPLLVPPILGAPPRDRPLTHRLRLIDQARARLQIPGGRPSKRSKRAMPFGSSSANHAEHAIPLHSPRHEQEGTRAVRIGVLYPEWDCHRGRYRPDHVAVREVRITDNGGHRRPPRPELVAWFRQSPDRTWRRRLEDGTDLDEVGYVEHICDRAASHHVRPRVYAEMRDAERDVATALLLDASSSLHAPRVLDLELACADALASAMSEAAERFAVFAFNGNTRHAVTVQVLHDFDDLAGDSARPVVHPAGYTRLGAPIRHVAGRLLDVPAQRRILLSIGDGMPCDEDYEGMYADADVARAVGEATEAGIVFHHIGVGAATEHTLTRRFGRGRCQRVDRIDALPTVLADVFEALRDQ